MKYSHSLTKMVNGLIRTIPGQRSNQIFRRKDVAFIKAQIVEDLDFYVKCDPAARNSPELVQNAYLSFQAVATYRIAHELVKIAAAQNDDKLFQYARYLSERAKVMTGVEIHPSAEIKTPFMIDHGWGTVIGETAEIGSRCCLLNGVVLGARGIAGNGNGKRHPTLGNDVQVGAFTEILGNIHIGNRVVIGPRLKITAAVPEDAVLIRKTEYWILRSLDTNTYSL